MDMWPLKIYTPDFGLEEIPTLEDFLADDDEELSGPDDISDI